MTLMSWRRLGNRGQRPGSSGHQSGKHGCTDGGASTTRKVLKRFYSDRILKNLLTISPLFESLNEAQKKSLLNRFKYVSLPAGADILVEGSQGDGLYVIVRGP
jgi:hypothetical protein